MKVDRKNFIDSVNESKRNCGKIMKNKSLEFKQKRRAT